MSIGKSLETWKEELVGKQFGRLTVIDVQPHIRKSTGNKDGYESVCKCTCGSIKVVILSNLINGNTQSCGCFSVESSKKNLDKAHKWRKEHPEESKEINRKNINAVIQWRKKHPEESRLIIESSLHKAQEWHKEHSKESKEISKKNLTKAQEWHKNHPEKLKEIGRKHIKYILQWHKDHPAESKKISKNARKAAQQWRKNHPEKLKEIGIKNVKFLHQWQRDHPDKFKKILLCNINKANNWRKKNKNKSSLILRRTLLKRVSKEETSLFSFLQTLDFPIERQFILENHYFDFKVNNFLIEYHGSIYHYNKYENLNNPKSKEPPSNKKDKYYHKELRNLALKNNYNLIQVWDFDWQNRKEFIQTLIQKQLSGIADYKNYVEKNLLNNDYGFNIDGELVEPKPVWVSLHKREFVESFYPKAKVLVYNSGYIKVK